MSDEVANDKVYIHEFIDIIGHSRARYMHHMTANWSPIAQEERNQLCYGVWGVVGSTGRWPAVVNLWEEDGWGGLAASFGHELGHDNLQDPKLARWWATAADMRSGGTDRLLVPATWSPTITELCTTAGGRRCVRPRSGHRAARESRGLPRTGSRRRRVVLRIVRLAADRRRSRRPCGTTTKPSYFGRSRAGSNGARRKTVCGVDIPGGIRQRETVLDVRRILLVDAPLSPLKIGRQPRRDDRDDTWSESEG